jgi:hypothetical protein
MNLGEQILGLSMNQKSAVTFLQMSKLSSNISQMVSAKASSHNT